MEVRSPDFGFKDPLETPQEGFAGFVWASFQQNIAFQTLIIPHIVALAKKRGHLKCEILPAEDIRDGIELAAANGIFRRRYDTKFGERMTTCPFSSLALELLTRSQGRGTDPEKSALFRIYQKIIAERSSNDNVIAHRKIVSGALKIIVDEHRAEVEQDRASKRPDDAIAKCPYQGHKPV